MGEREMIETAATRDALAERRRQVRAEGYSSAHDDTHHQGELARAAAAYAVSGSIRTVSDLELAKSLWPFEPDGFKHEDERWSLVAAAALLLAEIERLDRVAARKENRKHGAASDQPADKIASEFGASSFAGQNQP